MNTLLLASTAMFVSCVPVAAAVSSLAAPSVDRDAAVSYYQWLASSFQALEAAPPVLVDSITLKLDCAVFNQNVMVAITGSRNRLPDLSDVRAVADTSPLHPAVHPSDGSTTTITLQPLVGLDGPLLLPGREYWVVFGVAAPDWNEDSPAGLFHWSYAATSTPGESQDGWSVGGRTASSSTAGQNWIGEPTTPYSFALGLTAVPEPRTASMLLLAWITFCTRRRRRGLSANWAVLPAALVALTSCKRTPDPGTAASLPEGTIATVGGVALLQNDLDYAQRVSGNRPAAEVLRALTEEESLAQLARSEGLTEDPSVKAAMRRLLAARVREKYLASTPVSDAEVAAAVAAAPAVRPSVESLHLAFLRQKFENAGGAEAAKAKLESARVRWLALPPEQAAKGFGSIAVTHSDDTDTRYQGGDGGWILRGEPHLLLPKAATDAAAMLEAPGLLPEIVLGQDAAWLVAVLAIRQQPATRISEEQIRLQLESANRTRQEESLIKRAAAAAPVKLLTTAPVAEAPRPAETTSPPANPQ